MVSADPIRMFLYRWMIETGDPVEVIARGFDLDLGLVSGLLTGRISSLPTQDALRIKTVVGIRADQSGE